MVYVMQLLCLVVLVTCVRTVHGAIDCTKNDFVIGILSLKEGNSPLQEAFDAPATIPNSDVGRCFSTPNIVILTVEELLDLPKSGWTKIKSRIKHALINQANTKKEAGLSVVVGPFYQNLAMILDNMTIPYIVTDYMGFDWSDVSLIESTVNWKNMVKVRPPMIEFNRAVVDVFVMKKWESVVMIMPENPKENQECRNLARQMVEQNISPISYTLKYQDKQSMKKKCGEVLRNVQLLEQKRIVVCSPREEKYRLIQMILDEAKLFRMLDDETYSFFILDPTTQLDALTEINMYRRGLFTAKCDLFAYRYTELRNDTVRFQSGYGYGASDAERILNDAKFYYLTDNERARKGGHFSRDLFLRSLKKVVISDGTTHTGLIKFNATTGSRIGYTLYLYNHGGSNLFTKVGIWRQDDSEGVIQEKNETDTDIDDVSDRLSFFQVNDTVVRETRGIFDEVEKVVVVLEEPFVMIRQQPKGVVYTGNDLYEGFTIDLINKISENLNFKYEIILSPNNEYGGPKNGRDDDDSWGGIVGSILEKNATLGMGAISITSTRQSVIDFSLGVVSTGVNILITKPNEVFSIFQFLTPFSLELWMAIIGASFGVCIIYYILDFKSKERVFTVKSTLWFSLGTLLMTGSDFSPKRTSQRILTTGYLFFVLITVSTYTANMAAFLTKKNLEKPVDSFEQLADRDDINVYTVSGSATMNFLKTAGENTVYSRLWDRIMKDNGLIANATIGRDKVGQGSSAFIFDSMINSYSEKKYCRTQSVSSPILLQEHGIAMPKGAAFKSQLNIELLRLKESGFIQMLKKKWWENTRECDDDFQSRSSKQVSFDLKHTAGVFIVGCFGLGASLLLFIFKKLYVLIKSDNPFPPIRREENSDGSSTSKGHEEKLIYGHSDGKQSTV
ncbi:hypothetical protein ACF0H5_015746 [Mactra antiquata]